MLIYIAAVVLPALEYDNPPQFWIFPILRCSFFQFSQNDGKGGADVFLLPSRQLAVPVHNDQGAVQDIRPFRLQFSAGQSAQQKLQRIGDPAGRIQRALSMTD